MGDALEFADPEWLAKVAKGCSYYERSGTFFFLAICLDILLSLLAAALWEPFRGLVLIAGVAALVASLLIGVYGLWLIGTPHDRLKQQVDLERARQAFRVAVAAAPITFLVAGSAHFRGSPEWFVAIGLIDAPFGLIGAFGLWGFSRYMQQFAHRVNDKFTESRAKLYRQWFVGCRVVFAVGAGPAIYFGPGPSLSAAIPGGLGVLAFGILILALSSYLAKHLEHARRSAEKHWRAAGEK